MIVNNTENAEVVN